MQEQQRDLEVEPRKWGGEARSPDRRSAFQTTAPHYPRDRTRSSGRSSDGFRSLSFGELIPEGTAP